MNFILFLLVLIFVDPNILGHAFGTLAHSFAIQYPEWNSGLFQDVPFALFGNFDLP